MTIPNIPRPLLDFPLVSNWLEIEPTGFVKLRSGRVELGQGNATAIIQIAADELEVQPSQIRLTAGDTREVPDEGFTSGSQSIAVGGMSVRLACSAARQLFLREAAGQLQADIDELSIEDGAVLLNGASTGLTYWALAPQVQLAVPAAEHASTKNPSQRHVVGRSLPRVDLESRIAGAPFIHDFELPGMLHGRPIHPPTMRSRLVSLDIEALRKRPGVVQALRDGSFAGVVASREEVAAAAAEWALANTKWDTPDEAPADPVAAMAASTEDVEVIADTGDVGAAEGRLVETKVSRPYLSHASIGPPCAVARWLDGRLTVWSQTQGVYPLRDALALVFGVAPDAVEVIHVPGAGCYGHNGADDVALDASLLARAAPGHPVRVVWSRADDFGRAPLGPAMVTRASAVVDSRNRITAMSVTANSASHGNRPGRNGAPNLRAAAYLEKAFPVPRSSDIPASSGGGADRNAVPLYAIPNLRVVKRIVHELPYRTSSLRGLGAFINVFAIETLMDDIACGIGVDPVAFRLDHLEDERARHVVAEAARAADWPGSPGEGVGYGMGFARYKNTAAYCAVVARVQVEEDVRLTHAWACVDTGEVINPDGAVNQIEGGIVQSASWGLKEEVQFDGEAVSSLDWPAYPIMNFSEVPRIEVGLVSRPDDPPLGCGEAAQGPTVAAIGNAVRNALGVRIRALPVTREAIIAALA